MIKSYFSMLKKEFKGYNAKKLSKDMLSGLTVTAVALPLAIAFGVSCGADAAAGLITAILAGVIIGTLSGASFQISGPTGAMTAVLMTIIIKFKLQGVFVVCFLAGAILFLAGIFKLGKLVNMIPRPVVTGFTSGIAIIIALGQVDNFFGTVSEGDTAIQKIASYGRLGFNIDWPAMAIGLFVVAVMVVWPKKWNSRIPSSLIAIIAATVVSSLLKLEITQVGNIPRTLLPDVRFSLLDVDWSSIKEFISPAITVAALAMIESLLCGASASRMKQENFDADQELIAQGIGNMVIPFFGGVPATAAIARTSVAIKSGSQTRLTGIFHSVGLLASMFLLGPVMSRIPLAALAGVLMVTAWRMNEWSTIKYFFSKRFYGAILKFSVTMLATVVFDLTVAIVIGVIVSTVIFITRAAKLDVSLSQVKNEKLRNSNVDVEATHGHTYVAYVTGPIFFGNVGRLIERMHELDSGCNELIFSLRGVPAIDTTGVETVLEMCSEYKNSGINVIFCGVNDVVRNMLEKGGMADVLSADVFYMSVDRALLTSGERVSASMV